MLRWLLALICLQFLLGLGASAWAHTAHAAPTEAAWPAAVPGQCAAGQHAAGAVASDDDGAEVVDGSSINGVDLPDDQEFQRPQWAGAAPAFACPALAQPWPLPPPPHQRLRPPRA